MKNDFLLLTGGSAKTLLDHVLKNSVAHKALTEALNGHKGLPGSHVAVCCNDEIIEQLLDTAMRHCPETAQEILEQIKSHRH